jgi:hypothetical protein
MYYTECFAEVYYIATYSCAEVKVIDEFDTRWLQGWMPMAVHLIGAMSNSLVGSISHL